MRIVGIFDDKSGENHQLEIEAYDNEGDNPSLSNQETLSVLQCIRLSNGLVYCVCRYIFTMPIPTKCM